MAVFATNSDLVRLYPNAMDHGVADWTEHLAEAQGDIENIVKAKWFYPEFGSQRTRGLVVQPVYYPERLTASQWTKACVYRALSAYILPHLSTFRPEGDSFQEQMDFFDQRFDEEMDLQFGVGIEYDLNADGNVAITEKFPTLTNRLYR